MFRFGDCQKWRHDWKFGGTSCFPALAPLVCVRLWPDAEDFHVATPAQGPLSQESVDTMARLMAPLAVAGAFLAPGVDAFVRPSLPLSTSSVPISASPTSTPQHYSSSSTSQRLLRTSTAVLPTLMSAAGAVASLPAPAAAPSVKAPPDMYQNAVNVGEKKGVQPALKTFLMGIISGCHIAFGALLAITVGGNCPGLAATNPGLQKILFGAFGKPFAICLRQLMWAFPL